MSPIYTNAPEPNSISGILIIDNTLASTVQLHVLHDVHVGLWHKERL